VIRWEQPGYVVGFTTRVGGVSRGVYASLNLTLATGDDPGCVEENRRLACTKLGLDGDRLSFNRQVHSTTVHPAGGSGREGDGLWTSEPGLPMLAFAADCVPIAIAKTTGDRALAVLHAGWRGLSGGIVDAGVAALGGGELAAVVGPAIGPCCYEVGVEVSSLFDDDVTSCRRLDLWTAAERALRAAGVTRVERVDLCTRCHPELLFSYRRDGQSFGAQGVLGAVA
jgi:purine-nucleoside/S-methyl-5'-thioadenosine phosphorylase / adenosine deaminase